MGYLDEIDLNEIERITGKYLSIFLDNFQQIQFEQDNDEELTIITAGVKGLYSIMESVVILDRQGAIWCACLEPATEHVHYFTNHQNNKKPKRMQEWLSRFSDKIFIENGVGQRSV